MMEFTESVCNKHTVILTVLMYFSTSHKYKSVHLQVHRDMHKHTHRRTPTGNSPGMSLSWRVLEFPIGKGSLLELRDKTLEVRLCPLCHLITVPAGAVGIRLLNLGVELATVGEVVHRLESEGGLVPGEVQREIHVHKEAEVFPHEKKSELCESFGVILHHTRSKVAEEGSDVLSPLVVALDHILHLVCE